MEQANIVFTVSKYKSLRRAYNQAVADKKAEFTWMGRELVTAYAKYMLEYLDTRFKSLAGQ